MCFRLNWYAGWNSYYVYLKFIINLLYNSYVTYEIKVIKNYRQYFYFYLIFEECASVTTDCCSATDTLSLINFRMPSWKLHSLHNGISNEYLSEKCPPPSLVGSYPALSFEEDGMQWWRLLISLENFTPTKTKTVNTVPTNST